MLENIVIILGILFISIKGEKKLKIPSPLTIVLVTFGILYFNQHFMNFTDVTFFSQEMTIFIVLLVLVDAFIFRFEELKKNWISIIYLAGIAVVLSILIGVILFQYTIFEQYQLSIGAVIALFAMCLATDPVSVVATFKQYRIPHKIKFLAEGESLFNDAVALIMFSSFGLYLMQGNELTISYSVGVSLKVIGVSILIGFIAGTIGLFLMKTTKDTLTELVIILFIAYLS